MSELRILILEDVATDAELMYHVTLALPAVGVKINAKPTEIEGVKG